MKLYIKINEKYYDIGKPYDVTLKDGSLVKDAVFLTTQDETNLVNVGIGLNFEFITEEDIKDLKESDIF